MHNPVHMYIAADRAPPVLYDWPRQLHSLQERRCSSELDSTHEPSASVNKHQIIDATRRKRPTQRALGNHWPKPRWHRHRPPTSLACRLSPPRPGLATHTVPCALGLAAGLNRSCLQGHRGYPCDGCSVFVFVLKWEGWHPKPLAYSKLDSGPSVGRWTALSNVVSPWKCFLSAEQMPGLWNI